MEKGEHEMKDAHAAGEYLGVRPQTLAVWRGRGKGPKFYRVCGAIRYRLADLEKFLEQNAVTPDAALAEPRRFPTNCPSLRPASSSSWPNG